MTVAVIDASALIALIAGEPGADVVAPLLAESAMTTVNIAEVAGYFARRGAMEPEIHAMLDTMRFDVVPFDLGLAYSAALLLPMTRAAGLSLGDRACLALARRLGVRALTTDRVWSRIAAAVGIEIEMIR